MAEVKEMVGKAMTVCGPVPATELGATMMHEHLLIDLGRVFVEPKSSEDQRKAHAPLTLDNLSFAMMNWCQVRDNLVLDDVDLAIREAALFRQAGGGTLVDVTNIGLGRNPEKLRQIAEATGLHVVMGASYYHALFHPEDMDERSEDDICAEIVSDIQQGVQGSGIRAGIIGEVGCTWPLLPNEHKALRASARAQAITGAPISIHPGRHVDSPAEIIGILVAAGADPERIVMGHMERTGFTLDQLVGLARTGCYLEYDWFGEVRPAYPYGIVDVPSDAGRIDAIKHLIKHGYGDKILVSMDVCFKTRLTAFGGPGYHHFLRYVRGWMREKGVEDHAVHDMIVTNPARILQFV